MASLEHNARTLADVVNLNGAVMRDCFGVTEARQWMIMRVLDDMVRGETAVKFNVGIDWEFYKNEYVKFVEAQQPCDTPSEEAAPEHPSDAVMFGGS